MGPISPEASFRWTPYRTAGTGTGNLRFDLFRSDCLGMGKINWTALTSLHLDIPLDQYESLLDNDSLRPILAGAPLEMLAVWAEVCERIFADSHAVIPNTNPLFPRLRLLRLIFPDNDNTNREECESVSTWSTSVHRLLARRTEDGCPLDTLVVESYRDFQSTMQIFSTSATLVQYVAGT
jgi:hypothetical protein